MVGATAALVSFKEADELFPGAIQIVDLFHAKGTVSSVAKDIFGIDSEYGQQWAKKRRDEVEKGR